MKGTFFQRPLEFNLFIEGENWSQGDFITGKLVVRNHGKDLLSLERVQVHLALASLRKVHQRAEDAFDVLASRGFDASAKLAPGESSSLDWRFETELNSPVTDKTSSLYLVYGQGAAYEKCGQLELNVQPHALIQEFLKALRIQNRFVLKTIKMTKGQVEAKLDPPDGQAFATVEQASVLFRFEEQSLRVRYVFSVKGVEATSASVELKKKKKETEQVFAPTEYRTHTGRFDHERIERAIHEALTMVGANTAF